MTWKPISDIVNNNTLACSDTHKLITKNSVNIVNSHEPLDLYFKKEILFIMSPKIITQKLNNRGRSFLNHLIYHI